MYWVILLVFLFCGLSWIYIYLRRRNEIFKSLGLPGPTPKLLIGNLSDIKERISTLVLKEWTEKFGKVYGYMEGGRPVMVISDLDMLHEIFVKQFSIFHARKHFPLQASSDKDKRVNVFGANGARWKRLRAITNPIFTVSKLKQIVPLVNNSVEEFLELVGEKAGQNFDIYPFYQRMALDVIAKVAFGYETSVQQAEDSQLYNLCKQVFISDPTSANIILKSATVLPELLPVIKFVASKTARVRGVPGILIMDKLKKLITHLKSNQNKNGVSNRRVDFIQMMLEAEAEEGWEKDTFADDDTNADNTLHMLRVSKKLTGDEVVAQMMVVLLAGYETTSTSLAFLTYLLAKNPRVQKKLHDEIYSHFDLQNKTVDYESVSQLSYLDQVVKESLRLYPNASSVVSRRCMQPCKVGGYSIPKDLLLAADVWSIHYDTNIWGEDAADFKPERMAPEEQKWRHPMSWIPFGAGPRTCLGMRFALLEEKMVICHLLRNYNIVASDQTPDTLNLKGSVTVSPENVFVKLEPRT